MMGFWSTAEKDGTYAVREDDGAILTHAPDQAVASKLVNALNNHAASIVEAAKEHGVCYLCRVEGRFSFGNVCIGHHVQQLELTKMAGGCQ